MRTIPWVIAACTAIGLAAPPPSETPGPVVSPTGVEDERGEWSLPIDSEVTHIVIAPTGDIVVVGWAFDDAFPTTPDAVQSTCSRVEFGYCRSAFLSVFSRTGALRYSTFLAGDSQRQVVQVKPSPDGTIALLLGASQRFDGPPYPSLYVGEPPAATGCWRRLPLLVRLRPGEGRYTDQRCLSWSGMEGLTGGPDAALADDGSIWIVAQTDAWLPTLNAWQPSPAGGYDLFVLHFGAVQLQPLLATYLGGSDLEGISGVAVAPDGDLVMTGFTQSLDFPTVRAVQPRHGGARPYDHDGFLLRLDVTGRRLEYSTWLGGARQDEGTGVTLDATGNAYVVGSTWSENFPVTHGAIKTRNTPPSQDAFLVSVDPTGRVRFSTLLGGTGLEHLHGVVAGDDGSVRVVGETSSVDLPQVGPQPLVLPTITSWGFPFFAHADPHGHALWRATPIPIVTGRDPRLDDPTAWAAIRNELEAVAFDTDHVYVAGRTTLFTLPPPDTCPQAFPTGHYLKKWRIAERADMTPPETRR